MDRPPLDFRIVIDWRDFKSLPLRTWTAKRMYQMEEGAKALFDTRWDSGRLLLDYNKILFTFSFNSHVHKGLKEFVYHLALWEPVDRISLYVNSFKLPYDAYVTDKNYLPVEVADTMEERLSMYRQGKILCTVCHTNWENTEHIIFYPFAGGACRECAQSGKIPYVNLD